MRATLLAKRLRELQRAGVVEKRHIAGRKSEEYFLTPAGEELRPIIEGMGAWGQRWILFDVSEDDLDPSLLMWDIRRNVAADELPDHRVVVRFDFSDIEGKRRCWWLLAEAGEADVCMTDPGFEVDLRVTLPLRALTRYWLGQIGWSQVLASGAELEGPHWAARGLPEWLGRSSFAAVPRPDGSQVENALRAG